MKSRTKRLSRESWLDAALGMIVQTGIEGLRVKDLAAVLGSTTGSLYWHFEDRRALVDALLQHWAARSTEDIARRIENSAASPPERLLELLRLVSSDPATTSDLAIRAFAAFDRRAAQVVAKVDRQRHEVVYGLFQALGLEGDACEARTRAFLCYESCERFVFPRTSRAERERLLLERHRHYCLI